MKAALRVYDTVLDLARAHQTQSPEDFAQSYREAMFKIQHCMGEPGLGPVASLDTERADINRGAYRGDA